MKTISGDPRLQGMKVLVPQAEAIGMLAAIRALGRAGIEVHAVSSDKAALGLRSRYASYATSCPQFSSPDFVTWLAAYCKDHTIDMIVPSEALMLALSHVLADFKALLPISLDSEILALIYSKARTQLFYQQQGLLQHLPGAVVITADNLTDIRAELEELSYPVFVKADSADSLAGPLRNKSCVFRTDSAAEAAEQAARLSETYSHVLAQGFVPGQGAGVNTLRWQGNEIATYVNFCDHESPHTGGLCTLRSSWECPEMALDAQRRLQALNWHGVAMVEYRVDPATGRFYCIEINARFWAALHLALHAGANFPLFLAQLHRGIVPDVPDRWQQISCCYDVPAEVAHISSMLKDPDIKAGAKLMRLMQFFLLYLNPKVKLDMSFPGDRKLYFLQLARFLKLPF